MHKDSPDNLTATLVLGLTLGAAWSVSKPLPDSRVARAAVPAIRLRASGRCMISFAALQTDRYVPAPL